MMVGARHAVPWLGDWAGSADILSASTCVTTQPAGKMPALPAGKRMTL